MLKANYFILLVTALMCFFSSIEADETKTSWQFNNWNKYSKATVGRGSAWGKDWGIPSKNGWLWIWDGAEKLKNVLAKDPSGNTTDLVLRVVYPKGSKNPVGRLNGGLGFKAHPLTIENNVKTVELNYSVYFPEGFDFVKGGKLPGLYGGHGDCTGGTESSKCFTTRVMWRDNGIGEIYAYLPSGSQRSNLCDKVKPRVNVCNPDYGFSLGRGTFTFNTGQWTSIRQTLTINNVGKQDGTLTLYIDGKGVINQTGLVFRTDETGRVAGIMFHTFFGGSSRSWITPKTQYSYFKDFSFKTSS